MLNRINSRISASKQYLLFASVAIFAFYAFKQTVLQKAIIWYQVDPKILQTELYWKNEKGEILNSLGNLKSYVEQHNQKLLFAMNGGMFKSDYSPVGLFVQKGKIMNPLDTADGKGNFYLKPNGVFYITKDKIPFVCKTKDYKHSESIWFATQSGPMLLVNGVLNSEFRMGSENRYIRNGVGILPDGKLLFAMSEKEINFYDFAMFFKGKGCLNALYLDGAVSRTYLPEKNWIQTDGAFGVIIGVSKTK